METVRILINDQAHHVQPNRSLTAIIEQLSLPELGCVFAINNSVIPRSEWSITHLNEGDAISLFQAIAGG